MLTTNALIVERHISLRYDETAYTFLPVSRRELVAELRSSCLSQKHLDQMRFVLRVSDEHLVDICPEWVLVGHWCVFPGDSTAFIWSSRGGRSLFVDIYPSRLQRCVCARQTIRFYHLVSIGVFPNTRRTFHLRRIGQAVMTRSRKVMSYIPGLAPNGGKAKLTFRWDTCASS